MTSLPHPRMVRGDSEAGHTALLSVPGRPSFPSTTAPAAGARPIHLGSMTDEEILSWFRVTRDDLTTSTLEAELAERLAAALDQIEALETELKETTE